MTEHRIAGSDSHRWGFALRNHEHDGRLRLLDCIPDAVILVRQDGRIEFANAQTERVLGYASHELIDAPLEVLIPERFRAPHAEHWRNYVADPVFRPMDRISELVALRKDGQELPVEISLGRASTSRGVLAVATIRDVSRRKTEELRLREAFAEIESLRRRTLAENVYLKQELDSVLGVDEIAGESAAIKDVLRSIDQVAATDLNVIILGETGTGKELVARAIHRAVHAGIAPLLKSTVRPCITN